MGKKPAGAEDFAASEKDGAVFIEIS